MSDELNSVSPTKDDKCSSLLNDLAFSANLYDCNSYTPKKSNGITTESPFRFLRETSNSKGTKKDLKATKSDGKRRHGTSNNTRLDTLPIWVTPPKNVKEIPSYLKTICNRLLHVEKQIKKFCSERQGLLCAIWKLNDDGYNKFLLDPLLKSIISTLHEQREAINERPIEFEEPNLEVFSRSLDNIDMFKNINDETPTDDKTVNYNVHNSIETNETDPQYWKSSWLGINNDKDQDKSTNTTPINMRNLKRSNNASPIPLKLSSDGGKNDRNKKESTSILMNNKRLNEKNNTDDPLDYFKKVNFSELSQMDINSWTSFFGLKAMKLSNQIKQLERIRSYLIDYNK